MWLFTPNISFNLDHYKSIWSPGGNDTMLHLVPFFGESEDLVRFDYPMSALRAFDAVMNGIGRGCRSVFIQEVYTQGSSKAPALKVCYNKDDYMTYARTTDNGEAVICDPRCEPIKIVAPPGAVKS